MLYGMQCEFLFVCAFVRCVMLFIVDLMVRHVIYVRQCV